MYYATRGMRTGEADHVDLILILERRDRAAGVGAWSAAQDVLDHSGLIAQLRQLAEKER
jgi:hypothetical protein